MTARGDTALRGVAQKALARRVGSAADAAAVAAAAQRAYADLARMSAPLIGQVGVDALTGRALYLAQRTYPWLVQPREPGHWTGPFDQIVFCLEGQDDPALATQAAGAVLAILTELLVSFIGEPLTVRLLQKAWPDAFSDVSIEET